MVLGGRGAGSADSLCGWALPQGCRQHMALGSSPAAHADNPRCTPQLQGRLRSWLPGRTVEAVGGKHKVQQAGEGPPRAVFWRQPALKLILLQVDGLQGARLCQLGSQGSLRLDVALRARQGAAGSRGMWKELQGGNNSAIAHGWPARSFTRVELQLAWEVNLRGCRCLRMAVHMSATCHMSTPVPRTRSQALKGALAVTRHACIEAGRHRRVPPPPRQVVCCGKLRPVGDVALKRVHDRLCERGCNVRRAVRTSSKAKPACPARMLKAG